MRFYAYWLVVMMLVGLGALEKYINGFSGMFWTLICGALFFWMCSYGAILEERALKDPPENDDIY